MISFHRSSSKENFDVKAQVSKQVLTVSLVSEYEVEILTPDTLNNLPEAKKPNKIKKTKVGPELKVKLEDMQAMTDWTEGSIFVFVLNVENLSISGPVNIRSETFNSKQSIKNWYESNSINSIFGISVPHKKANFEECGVYFNIGLKSKLNINQKAVEQHPRLTREQIVPVIQMIAPPSIKADASADIKLIAKKASGGVFPHPITVYLEAVEGYLPKTRVELVNGEGRVKAMALGLETGDNMRIKAGFRFVTGLVEHTFKVT